MGSRRIMTNRAIDASRALIMLRNREGARASPIVLGVPSTKQRRGQLLALYSAVKQRRHERGPVAVASADRRWR